MNMSALEIILWLALWTLCCGPVLFFLGAVGTVTKMQADLKAKGLRLQYEPKLQRWILVRVTETPVSANDATIQR